MTEFPIIEGSDVAENLRRGCIPVTRPVDELVRYTVALENAIGNMLPMMPFEEIHDVLCPHWVDLLEKGGDR